MARSIRIRVLIAYQKKKKNSTYIQSNLLKRKIYKWSRSIILDSFGFSRGHQYSAMRAYMQYPSAPDQLLRSSVKRVTSVPLHLSAIPAITGKKGKN